MKFIDPIIIFSAINIQVRGQYLNWDSEKVLSRSPTLLKSKYFLILVKTVNFLFALMQILVKCSSDFNSFSIVIRNSLTVLFSH